MPIAKTPPQKGKQQSLPDTATKFVSTLRLALTGNAEMSIPLATEVAEWALLIHTPEKLSVFTMAGTISGVTLRKLKDSWPSETMIDPYEHIRFASGGREEEVKKEKLFQTGMLLKLLDTSEKSFWLDNQIGLLATGCYLKYDVKDDNDIKSELTLNDVVIFCGRYPMVSSKIAEMLKNYPSPEKGLVLSLRSFLGNLLELIHNLPKLEQEKAADPRPSVTEKAPTEAKIAQSVSPPAVKKGNKREIIKVASAEGTTPMGELLLDWNTLPTGQAQERSHQRKFARQFTNLLNADMEANVVPLLAYLHSAESGDSTARAALALALIEGLPTTLISDFLRRISVSLLLSCARRSPVASVMQSASDALALRLMERLQRAYYGQTPFVEAQETLEAMRELAKLAPVEDRAAFHWRFFHALTETSARARQFTHLNDTQGGGGFLDWLRRSLLPSLPLEERFRLGVALIQSVLEIDASTQEKEPMYPILRDLIIEMEPDDALRTMLALPPTHRGAFLRYLIT